MFNRLSIGSNSCFLMFNRFDIVYIVINTLFNIVKRVFR